MVHLERRCLCCRQELRTKDWRKALIGDRWFTEGGFILGGRPTKDLSWFKELRKPFWWVCAKAFDCRVQGSAICMMGTDLPVLPLRTFTCMPSRDHPAKCCL